MKKEKFSLFTFLRKGLCTLLALWVLLAAPTGWLYDLWAGEGSGQGQRPDDSVSLLRRQEEVEAFFLSGAPATVSGGQRVACPLARLRDPGQAGIHHRNGPGRGSVYVSEYIAADYPLSLWDRAVQSVVGGFYNRYYLLELDDGTCLCTYFDDYLTLMGGEYPAGTVRHTTTEERRMLERMAEDYEVDTVYVLDMYRHGKANWMLDLALRLAVLAVGGFAVMTVGGRRQKGKPTKKD